MQLPALLALLAVAAAWTGTASWPLTGTLIALALAVLLLFPKPASRPCFSPRARWLVPVAVWITVGLWTGWDRGQALTELTLAALVLAVIAGASARAPGSRDALILGAGVSLLGLWALWQVTTGFDLARASLSTLPEGLRAAARFRLDSGRAFASQLHPGHLAVLLATAVPLAGGGVLGKRHRIPWTVALCLAALGLVLTRSPLGLGLAVLALLAVWRSGKGALYRLTLAVFAGAFVAVFLLRPDLLHLQPMLWRLENWHNALWVWTSAPITGVGLGGFGQAALTVPFPVANHPQHAHCLPLEWLAEMGVPGLIFFLLLYGWIFSVARRLWSGHRSLAAALLVIPLHNLVDFSLFEPGIAVTWAVLAGWALAVLREEQPQDALTGRQWIPGLAACLAAVFFGLSFASSTVESHTMAATAPSAVVQGELRAFNLAPWRPFPRQLAEAARSAQGDTAEALAAALARARWWRPHSAALASIASEVAVRNGDFPKASRDAWEARTFLPLDRRPEGSMTGAER